MTSMNASFMKGSLSLSNYQQRFRTVRYIFNKSCHQNDECPEKISFKHAGIMKRKENESN
jgi:hypothetical protein